MQKLSDYLLITDMDGTLLGPDGQVPERNAQAVRRFVAKGGRFGIATGRSRELMLEKAGELPINAPCVLYNGGALYDFATDRMLWEIFLPDAARGYVEEIMEAVPGIGVLVISGDSYYEVRMEKAFAESNQRRNKKYFKPASLDNLKRAWYKILFQVQEKDNERFHTYVQGATHAGVRYVSTNHTLIEMLPEVSNKGYALEKLIGQGIVRREQLVTIGDFYNDLEMIELAGIGVTLNTSPPDIQQKADLIVGNCADGAVADLIEHLERMTGE